MCKPKVQTLVASILSGCEIKVFLFLGHGIPLCGSLLVDVHIEELCANEEDNVEACNGDEHFVTSVVEWRIVRTVYVDADNVASLHTLKS